MKASAMLALLPLWLVALNAQATECANAGAAPTVAPDDTGDGTATACGSSSIAGGTGSLALGQYASSAGSQATAVGYLAVASGAQSLSVGFSADATGNLSSAFGYDAQATQSRALSLGSQSEANGLESIALGNFAQANATRSTAVGAFALADQPYTIILGGISGLNGAPANSNVGIGTTMPVEAVDVQRSAAAARFQLTAFTNTATEAPQYIQRRARGTSSAPAAVQANDNLGLFSFRGYNGTVMGGSRATITAQAAGNFTVSSTPTRLIFATTPVGQTAPVQVMVITPDGKVQVNGQNLTVPDYVFEDDYALMPLAELRTFIDANGHLPGVAPAGEVQTEGLDLAGAQMGQLQKIEELTLYVLQLQDRILQLETKLAGHEPAY